MRRVKLKKRKPARGRGDGCQEQHQSWLGAGRRRGPQKKHTMGLDIYQWSVAKGRGRVCGLGECRGACRARTRGRGWSADSTGRFLCGERCAARVGKVCWFSLSNDDHGHSGGAGVRHVPGCARQRLCLLLRAFQLVQRTRNPRQRGTFWDARGQGLAGPTRRLN